VEAAQLNFLFVSWLPPRTRLARLCLYCKGGSTAVDTWESPSIKILELSLPTFRELQKVEEPSVVLFKCELIEEMASLPARSSRVILEAKVSRRLHPNESVRCISQCQSCGTLNSCHDAPRLPALSLALTRRRYRRPFRSSPLREARNMSLSE
jgi:hypothetical protein